VNVSLSLLAAIPRIADSLHLDRLIQFLPASWSEHVGVIFLIWLVFVPPSLPPTPPSANPIRAHLVVGGILVLALWLLSPTLLGSLSP